MFNIKNLLGFSLSLFDGEDTSSTPADTTSNTEGSEPVVNAPQQKGSESPAKVIYGKVETEDSGNPDIANQGKEITAAEERATKYAEYKSEYKDLYGKDVEAIIKDRFKNYNGQEAELGQMKPIIALLMEQHNITDPKELHTLLQEQSYEAIADREGYDVDQVRQMEQLKRENKDLASRFDSEEQKRQVDQKISDWYSQEANVKVEYPDFSLDAQAKNKDFMKLLDAGIDVKQAYELTNMDEIKANIAKKAEQNTVTNIRSNKSRIKENALNASPGVIVKSDPSKFTAEDRKEIARRASMGEQIKL